MDIGVIILAIIQGIAEFLPISSSAHLIIFRDLFGIAANSVTGDFALTFDIALHFGTLLAICIYFFKDWIDLIVGGYKQVVKKEKTTHFYPNFQTKTTFCFKIMLTNHLKSGIIYS